jgi:hypothetical protein
VIPSRLLAEDLASKDLTEKQRGVVRRIQDVLQKARAEAEKAALIESTNPARDTVDDAARSLTTRSALNSYEQRYYRSERNPLYAWLAIGLCTDPGLSVQMPRWCADYLHWAASRLMSLSEGTIGPNASLSWERAIELLPRATGFSRKGWNAFKSDSAQRQAVKAAAEYDLYRGQGLNAREAYDLTAKFLGLAEPDSARGLVRAGKKLLKATPPQVHDQAQDGAPKHRGRRKSRVHRPKPNP